MSLFLLIAGCKLHGLNPEGFQLAGLSRRTEAS
jgi:hypothetical protein